MEFIDANNPNDRFEVVNGNDSEHYKIVKKGGWTIYLDDNTKILYYVSPESNEKIQRINKLREAIAAQNEGKQKVLDVTYNQLLDLRKKAETKQPSFKGNDRRRELYNPQYNFRTHNAYVQKRDDEKGSKLSLVSR